MRYKTRHTAAKQIQMRLSGFGFILDVRGGDGEACVFLSSSNYFNDLPTAPLLSFMCESYVLRGREGKREREQQGKRTRERVR